MNSFGLCKKVKLHIYLEGAVSPEFVRQICQIGSIRITDGSDKSGNNSWQNLEQFLCPYEVVANIFLVEKNFEPLIRHFHDQQVKESAIYTVIVLEPHLWNERPSERWEGFLNIETKVSDEYEKKYRNFTYFVIVCIGYFSPEKTLEVAQIASNVKAKNVGGFGMAGNKKKFKVSDFTESLNDSGNSGLGITVHPGEICVAKFIDEAVRLGVTRIGHGVRSRESEETIAELLEKNILLESCLVSNIALALYPSLEEHPINFLLNKNLPIFTLAGDFPYCSATLSKEYEDIHNDFWSKRGDIQ